MVANDLSWLYYWSLLIDGVALSVLMTLSSCWQNKSFSSDMEKTGAYVLMMIVKPSVVDILSERVCSDVARGHSAIHAKNFLTQNLTNDHGGLVCSLHTRKRCKCILLRESLSASLVSETAGMLMTSFSSSLSIKAEFLGHWPPLDHLTCIVLTFQQASSKKVTTIPEPLACTPRQKIYK